MSIENYPQSGIPIRRTVDLLPEVFKTDANTKFMSGVIDPLVQPGSLQKIVGYLGRRYGKTYNSKDVYLDTDNTLRSRYQLEPGVVIKDNKDNVTNFYDYIDFKNQLKFFNNQQERDDLITDQDHYSWNPPIDWDKFVNFREYYWMPDGPPPITIFGQQQGITSSYRVRQGVTDTWIFFPDGLTNNPTLTLYRGQTYKFQVNSPNEPFVLRTNYDTGSLLYKPYLPYSKNQLAIFDNKLWRAKKDIPVTDQSTIDEFSEDWEFVEDVFAGSALDYNKGVTNNGVINGTLTFNIPLDAPDVLYYQSATNINRFGKFLIADISSNTKIDVEKEIVGKVTYTSSNGIIFSNGMKLRFEGLVSPSRYSTDTWIVEGVGESIQLIRFQDLIPPTLSISSLEVLFDDGGFDTEPFDDAASYPETKDYITINRASRDSNPWSRYNRWFHKSVLEQSYIFSNSDFDAAEIFRAKRPIIEFKSHLKLFNHGAVAKPPVDFIDTFTKDVFSTIEGSLGYNVDGEELFDGARLLVVADTDILANNKIYKVNFIRHNNRRQINLTPADDAQSNLGEGVFVRRGVKNSGTMFHYDGTNWVSSQKKTTVNQSPQFDVFDDSGVSFGDRETYPVSTFVGSKILSYKVGSSVNDNELGFSLSYLNIDNVGDIEFNFDWDTDSFSYQMDQSILTEHIRTGFYQFSDTEAYGNNWIKVDRNFLQPIVETITVSVDGNTFSNNAVDWQNVEDVNIFKVLIYVNGKKYSGNFTRNQNEFTIDTNLKVGDVVTCKIYTSVEPLEGYYEIPLGLEKNPLNQEIKTFTLGQATDHVSTALDLFDGFLGGYPGPSNLRDINGYQNLGRRFLKHSGCTPTAMTLLCDKNINIIKSLQFAKKSYQDFKNNFVRFVEELDFDGNVVTLVDNVLEAMTKTKTSKDAFADSDMAGYGAYTPIVYVVEDTGINTFVLTEKFDLTSLSRKSVYVYLNDKHLLHGRDYVFDYNFGFIQILANLNESDVIEIREYTSTSSCFIPPTPTKLGLYKKWKPEKYLDKTYFEETEVIRGHDGSLTIAYGDYRDDALLELEKRIYNNIKQEYNTDLFDIDIILGSYYHAPYYDKNQFEEIIFYDFLKWLQDTNIDYQSNSYFNEFNSFSYTYSQMSDPTKLQNLPGWWRGVYKWFYDTDKPHLFPWEMLGFTEKPNWWEEEYGPAPYTKNNLILWEDLSNGIIRQGDKAGIYDRYKRQTLLNHIPVDGDGNLLSPFDSGLANNFINLNNTGVFKFGDQAPVEYAWRTSSEYPFTVISALCLLRPFEFIIESLDRSRITTNKLGQTINIDTKVFAQKKDLVYPIVGSTLTSGLINYIVDYVKFKGQDYTFIKNRIDGIDCLLSTRLSGFVDQAEQKFLLDSKNPRATSSSIFIPPENYNIIFNVSAPIVNPSYSGMIIEKVEGGFKIYGYDSYEPYFTVVTPLKSDRDPLISVGGVSEQFVEWTLDKEFTNGTICRYNDLFYRALRTHRSSENFDSTLWQRLAKLPLVNALEVFSRRNWQESSNRIPYGTIVNTIQEVADIMLGYEQHLIKLGFEFNGYDTTLEVPKNWTTSVKEFLFWTRHKWSVGSILSVSPAATKIELNVPVGVADNLLDSFYDYNILKDDGNILTPEFIDVTRDFQKISVNVVNTEDGIYFFKCYFVLKEHVVLFSDRTVFNDVLYDKPTGYRQERVKSRGFRTVDWDGDYTSPGFLFDNVDIKVWQPFTDYKLGDIVSYKSYNWTSLVNQSGAEKFDDTTWSKLDITPVKGLVRNFDFNVGLFEDFYSVDADGVGSSQRDLARHIVGYQTREYLQNLAEDNVTQFKLYQGFVKEKGTANSITKVFDKISQIPDDSVVLNEEWAIQVGKIGGTDQINEIEFKINKKDLLVNPQPVLIIEGPKPTNNLDRYLRINQTDFNRSLLPYTTNINPTTNYIGLTRDAGYVKTDQVEVIVKDEAELLTLDINSIVENSHIWLTFYKNTWNVYRFNLDKSLIILNIQVDTAAEIITITYNQPVGFRVDDIIGIRGLEKLDGFHRIISVAADSITIVKPENYSDTAAPDESSLQYNTYILNPARFNDYQSIDDQSAALLKEGSKVYIDKKDDIDNNWEVIEKQRLYTAKDISQYGATDPRNVGRAVVYLSNLDAVITGIPNSNIAVMYKEADDGLRVNRLIYPESGYEAYLNDSFGDAIAVSPDGRWLAIGAPLASGVPSRFKGYFSAADQYQAGDLVLFNGQLWEALNEQNTIAFDPQDDGSTDTLLATSNKFRDLDWKISELVTGNLTGLQGPTNQGVIFLYQLSNNQWSHHKTILSPRISAQEKFGQKITIGVSGNDYYMAVSAPGSLEDLGRVYLYKYTGSGARTSQQVLTIGAGSSVNFVTNVITFNRDHNYITGQTLRYFNGTFNGDNKSEATSPPPPEDNAVFYAIRVDNKRIQLASTVIDAALGNALDLKDIGIDDSSSHTFINSFDIGWRHLDNANYRGLYDTTGTSFYAVDSIVWANDNLYKAVVETIGNTDPIDENVDWERLENTALQNSLPSSLALEDTPSDGPLTDSTMEVGSVYPIISATEIVAGEIYTIVDFGTTNFEAIGYNPASSNLTFKATDVGTGNGSVKWVSYQFAELLNPGDLFGSSMTMNRDASILVIGAPESNGQYFANYKGQWKSWQTYYEDDVVKYNEKYYRLTDVVEDHTNDSALQDSSKIISSIGQPPSTFNQSYNVYPTDAENNPFRLWFEINQTVSRSAGKIFIYKRINDVYELKQVITNGNLDSISDTDNDENINAGDNFGQSLDIDHTGTTLIVSAPRADRTAGDQGAVFVFKTNDVTSNDYRLKQVLVSHETYANEFFGTDVSISSGTERIVVGAKNATFKLPTTFDNLSTTFDNTNSKFFADKGNTGQVYIFERKDQKYFLTEKLIANNLQDWESFGSSVDCNGTTVVVGSPTFRNNFFRTLNNQTATRPVGALPSGSNLLLNLIISDGKVVSIEVDDAGSGYSVSDFNNLLDVYEILGSTTNDPAQFRITSVNIAGGVQTVFVINEGSGYTASQEVLDTGNVRIFRKESTKKSWNTISERSNLVNLDMINSISVYNEIDNLKLGDLQIVDHYKLKILGEAEQELTYKTLYDPAVYTNGTSEQEVDESTAWFEKHVGDLWWDLSTVKFLNYEQGDIAYRTGNWNSQVYGSNVDVYEWVETKYLPSRWATLADTTEGIAQGISGQPLHPDNSVYSVRILTNPATGETSETKYYYWVKNKTVLPKNVPGRRLAASFVAGYIENPLSTGIQFVAPIAGDKFALFNFNSLINKDYAVINIQYKKQDKELTPIHNEYILITEDVPDSLPNDSLENKWIDSLVGYDRAGHTVPDDTIPVKQRYGLSVRPRQSMFKDRFPILRRSLERINFILSTRAFADTINYTNLNLVDEIPNEILNEYDLVVDTLLDLGQVGTTRVRKAVLNVNIVDGAIDTIDIIDGGFGYKNIPFITIEGDGVGALAVITTDNQGRVNSVTVTSRGRNYTTALVQIRYFSVLVRNDSSINNYWSIYSWNDQRRTFFRSKSQAYDTTKYWEYVDFWAEGYSLTSRIVQELLDIYQEPTINVEVGDLIKIKEFANGGWAVLEKTEPAQGNLLDNYNLVGRQNGTIRIKIDELSSGTGVGYDRVSSYDADLYDLNPTLELRNILKAAKEDIFIEDLRTEWNRLFFTSLRYVFVEQQYVDWAFKTSFLNATHNVGNLEQKVSYKNDNLDSFLEYIEEVKPYRTTIREYVSRYIDTNTSRSAVTDFDLPPYYSQRDGKIIPVARDSSLLSTYPYKWWTDNNGYEIVEIVVTNRGSGYTEPPLVIIEGNGAGATAQAYINNGSVRGIKILTTGFGYAVTPKVSLVGGNGTNQDKAKAVAILGNSPVRTFDLTLKFDRLAKQGRFNEFNVTETFTASGVSAIFSLKYAPSRDKSKIVITKNNDIVLSSEYTLTLFYAAVNGYSGLQGRLRFNITPQLGDVIVVSYEKNMELFDSVNRIQRMYAPTEGMRGAELSQLMTGIDFGGVQIQGTTFDVTGGWDALPWFTDSWDSVESNSDFYYVADGSTTNVTLPFTPAEGEQISIYWKPSGTRMPSSIDTLGGPSNPQVILAPEVPEPKTVRIDDPNWIESWDSSNTINPDAQMPTFVGDGSTRVVEIGKYLTVQAGDILIFRKLDSDGSVTITDVNLVDTNLTGGSLSAISGAYQTATGATPEEIVVDGDKFINPDQVPAPEENVPGQVLESVSIKVYHTFPQGAAPLQNRVIYADGAARRFGIGLTITEDNSLMVYKNKVKQSKVTEDSSLDYDIDYANNEIVFTDIPALGDVIEIISFGIGGINLLDYQEFIADGQTTLFLTKAVYSQTESVLVTVDGVAVDVGFQNSIDFTDTENRTIIQFGREPSDGAVVKVICLGAALDTDSSNQSIVRVNQQVISYDGSSTRFELDRFVNLSRASAESSILVTLNGVQLKGPENTLVTYDGTNNKIAVGTDPLRSPGSITYLTIEVYINNQLLVPVTEWTLNSTINVVTVVKELLELNDVIRVVVNSFADYRLEGDGIVLTDDVRNSMNQNDVLEITWFSEYPSMDIVTDQYSGGKVNYKLSRAPINESYVWVYLNGTRLTLNKDYKVSIQRAVVYLNVASNTSDEVKIIEFGNDLWQFPSAFEIYKDMLNRYQFKRFSRNNVVLAKPLNYYDTSIEVVNGNLLYDPTDLPAYGVVYINNERIEYLQKTGNVLSQLRRGSTGTAIAEVHLAGSFVSDSGPTETIPYNETQHRQDFVSDGSTLLVGPLDFTPKMGLRANWYRETIPAEYGACDEIEIFVAGTRLRKNPLSVYDENLGADSPSADRQIEAEFSVDGASPYIRLTKVVPAGTRITVLRRTGNIWYDRGQTTASLGKTLKSNNTAIAKFILQKTTIIPE
jgi:hypothetical protein